MFRLEMCLLGWNRTHVLVHVINIYLKFPPHIVHLDKGSVSLQCSDQGSGIFRQTVDIYTIHNLQEVCEK